MPPHAHGALRLGFVLASVTALGCSGSAGDTPPIAEATSGLSAEQRLAQCAQDPRVLAGLVTPEICAGADIFFRETFDGNGRTCGSCHPVENNFTIDRAFISALHQTNPMDPLFVFEHDPALAQLETADLHNAAAILENVDGFEAPTTKFVSRSVPHLFSLSTSITPDPADGTSNPPVERVGWGGDGPGDGSLRAFLEGAVIQHFPKTLAREPGVDFRTPTPLEADLATEFQLSLGRLNELDLTQVRIFDPVAEDGRQAFLDPMRGRCNVCHANAGANFQDTGFNRNFDNGIRFAGSSNPLTLGRIGDIALSDGGFGGVGLEEPNLDANGIGFPNAFGNGTFSPPPLIEAADTAPFFHTNLEITSQAPPSIEQAVQFYSLTPFAISDGAKELEQRFGAPLNLQAGDGLAIARFLRVLNGAFNLDLARQRLEAARTLAEQFHDTRADIQLRLIELAEVEIDDALEVLGTTIYPVAQERLALAKDEIALALAAPSWQVRHNRVSNAISRVLNARDHFGSNIDFQLGKGNLMF